MKYYNVRAESHGSVYTTRMIVTEEEGSSKLTWIFDAEPVTTGAKIMSFLIGFMFKGATKKALVKDLEDIKAAAEKDSEESAWSQPWI